MKQQRFRYKIVALLLVGLLGIACAYAIRIIPLNQPAGELRSAILRLTGRSPSPSPASVPVAEETEPPAPVWITEGLGTLIEPPGETPRIPDSPSSQSLTEALTKYFESVPGSTAAAPSP